MANAFTDADFTDEDIARFVRATRAMRALLRDDYDRRFLDSGPGEVREALTDEFTAKTAEIITGTGLSRETYQRIEAASQGSDDLYQHLRAQIIDATGS